MSTLLLRRAGVSRPSGSWQHNDFDVFDGNSCYGDQAASLDEAKALFRSEYEKWQREG